MSDIPTYEAYKEGSLPSPRKVFRPKIVTAESEFAEISQALVTQHEMICANQNKLHALLDNERTTNHSLMELITEQGNLLKNMCHLVDNCTQGYKQAAEAQKQTTELLLRIATSFPMEMTVNIPVGLLKKTEEGTQEGVAYVEKTTRGQLPIIPQRDGMFPRDALTDDENTDDEGSDFVLDSMQAGKRLCVVGEEKGASSMGTAMEDDEEVFYPGMDKSRANSTCTEEEKAEKA